IKFPHLRCRNQERGQRQLGNQFNLVVTMTRKVAQQTARLQLEGLEIRELPATSPLYPAGLVTRQSFDSTAVGALPPGWSQWANSGAFAVSTDLALSRYGSLANDGVTGQKSLAWANTAQPANVQVSASVYLNSIIPAEVLARGSRLNTNTPTFYAVTVTRG